MKKLMTAIILILGLGFNPAFGDENIERAEAVKNFLTYVEEGNLSKVKLALTSSELEINKGDEFGNTALYKASSLGNTEVVELLLGHPDINVNSSIESPLHRGSFLGHTGVVGLLLSHPNIEVNKRDLLKGNTPLIFASFSGKIGNVGLLLDHPDIDVNMAGVEFGYTPLMWAAMLGHIDIVKVLLGHPDIDKKIKAKNGYNAYKWAKKLGFKKIAKLIRKARRRRRSRR